MNESAQQQREPADEKTEHGLLDQNTATDEAVDALLAFTRSVDCVDLLCPGRPPVTDVVQSVLHRALDGLALRQRTIADNIANIETPRFLAGRVDFESSLRAAVAEGRPATDAPTTARSLQPTRLNGNNVNLDEETLAAMETGLRYELTIQAITSRFNGIRTAIGNR